jgi:hypothetical protein
MKGYLPVVLPLAAVIAIAAAGCRESRANHKLVSTDGKHSVLLYPDETTYQKVSHQPADADRNAQPVDDQTPVVIISTDDSGAVVQIIEGPMTGKSGFVTKGNLD